MRLREDSSDEDSSASDTYHNRGLRERSRVRGAGLCGGRHVAHALRRLRHAAGAHSGKPAFLGYLRAWRPKTPVRLQLLSRQARRRLSLVGHRPRHDRAKCRAEGEPRRSAREAQPQARSD
jgi:hypothetical protein